mmetsp:Transcript_42074/g.78722  ORF Transcript_42074/g.78722 Transcript_42074/m.78722 type:complete len:436 (-) Transcript_42074:255-1562(-)
MRAMMSVSRELRVHIIAVFGLFVFGKVCALNLELDLGFGVQERAHPPTPECEHARGRYLLPVAFGGLNNQKKVLWKSVLDANTTSRHLMLPLLIERPHMHWQGKGELMSLSQVYDPQHFCDMVASLGVCVVCHHFLPRFMPESLRLQQAWKNATFDTLCTAAKRHTINRRCNATGAQAVRRTCGVESEIPFLYDVGPQAKHTVITEQAMLFYKTAFLPTKGIQEMVTRVRVAFEGQQYVALHMRIEDDWRKHLKQRFLEGSEIVRQLAAASETLHLREHPMYLACGQPSKAMELVEPLTPKTVLHRGMIENETLPYLVQAVVDEEICKGASVVISDIKSSFGLNLWLQRSMLFAAEHSQDCMAGMSYSYGTTNRETVGDCSGTKISRVGWYRTQVHGEAVYTLTRQGCEQREEDFVHSIFGNGPVPVLKWERNGR